MFYFHVGMHKTGTTFMQKNVFPKFHGIKYLPPWSPFDRFLRLHDKENYLYSNERLAGILWATQSQVDSSLKQLSDLFPSSRILISFRRHDGFIVSSYKQFLHEGGTLKFEEYFDINNDRGFMKKDQFLYKNRIDSITKHFGDIPFTFLQDEIKKDLQCLLKDIEKFIGAAAPKLEEINMQFMNTGVSYYQAKVLRWLNQFAHSHLNPDGRFKIKNAFTSAFRLEPRQFSQHWLGFLPDKDFLTSEQRQKIIEYYKEDWNYTLSCVKSRAKTFRAVEQSRIGSTVYEPPGLLQNRLRAFKKTR
ncbi:hypothetical protein Nhal_2181 [Nitrosococcus halophilus Nc 4]|uniref:Sulfotransferase domain-containing protein n=1 Tax=Nitrosococcus halophilus (strain Nc4) TaxID=472759 RepID=D5C555_NITHN|nr:hypothetical protein [Nitrosococcus halophilus]ADE15278.1 hypothetical protein Nhal_2181 [Nitrosococcus halophilus Nc 4]